VYLFNILINHYTNTFLDLQKRGRDPCGKCGNCGNCGRADPLL